MSVLEQLPTKERFGEILGPVLGDDSGGVLAAKKLLDGLDPASLTDQIAARLDGALTDALRSGAGGTLTGDIAAQFRDAVGALPADPAALVAPVRDIVARIGALAGPQLAEQLRARADDFGRVTALVPTGSADFLAEVAPAIDGVKRELVSGRLGELRQWSTGVDALRAEIAQVIGSPTASVEDALVAFLANKVADLLRLILPDGGTAAVTAAGDRLRAAVSAARLAEIAAAKTAFIAALRQATDAVQRGNDADAFVTTAEQRLREMETTLTSARSDLESALGTGLLTVEGITSSFERRIADFEHVTIVDVGGIRGEFAQAIGSLEAAVRDLHLERAAEAARDAFGQLNEAIDGIGLAQFADELEEVRRQMRELADSIDAALLGAVASARDLLQRAREALRSVAESVGEFDAEGKFHFAVEDEIRDFLTGVQQSLDETVRPIVDELRDTIGGAIAQVESLLQSVEDQIAEVKRTLEGTLQGAVDQLEAADIPGQLDAMRNELATMLDQLGTVDFDAVTDPVIQQIDETADSLASIDTSSLNDMLRAALKEAVKVITDIDFSAEISDVLKQKMDEVLAYPAQGLRTVQDRVDDAVGRLSEFAPEKLLEPLHDAYAPVMKAMDEVQLANLIRPLDAWHQRALAELDKVSPSALLAPVVELHGQLSLAAASVAPAELVRPLRAVLDEAAAAIERVDVGSLSAEVRAMTAQAREALDSVQPERLLDPVTSAYTKIVGAVEAFDPKTLLEPLNQVFEGLTAPLANISPAHARAIEQAFAPLLEMPSRMDPRPAFAAASTATAEVQRALGEIDLGRLIADLRAPLAELRAAIDADAPGATTLLTRVDALDPLHNDAIGRAATDFRALAERLGRQFSATEPPAALIERYETARPRLESLIPEWARGPITPDSVRAAFAAANPLGVGPEVDKLYAAVKEQLRALDPAQIQQEVRETYEHVKEALLGLDPAVLLDELQADLTRVVERLRSLDLGVLSVELDGMAADLRAVVAGLDPRPVIEQLEGLLGQVRALVEALRPSELLKSLEEPLQSARSIVAAFDPATLAEPLRAAVARIQEILKQVDLTTLLEPVTDKLHQLREDLEAALDRTETAFDHMIAAVPL